MTVIRQAVIQIRTERVGGAGGAGGGFEARAFEREKQAAKEAATEVTKLGMAHDMARVKMVATFRESGEGALRYARGLAFLSASGEEDLRRLAQSIATAQGAFDVFAGGSKALSTLGVAFGPVGIAVAGVTLAVSAGALAWKKWNDEARQAAEQAAETERHISRLSAVERQRLRDIGFGENAQGREFRSRITDAALTPQVRIGRVSAEQLALRERLASLEGADLRAAAEFVPEFRRPIHGTPARVSRIEEDRRRRLIEIGNPEALDAANKVQQERSDIAQRLLQLEQEEYQLKQQQLQRDRNQAVEHGGFFGLIPQDRVRSAADRVFEQRDEENARRHQAAADRIVEIWETAANELRLITNAQER